jgi:hypothetical protein
MMPHRWSWREARAAALTGLPAFVEPVVVNPLFTNRRTRHSPARVIQGAVRGCGERL